MLIETSSKTSGTGIPTISGITASNSPVDDVCSSIWPVTSCSTICSAISVVRVHRNYVVKLRKLSIQNYMKTKCNVRFDSQAFWRTVGPLISDKRKQTNDNLSLVENDDIINNKMKMCDICN